MKAFNTVLVPIDFREHTLTLADFALSITQKLGAAQVTFVHVLPYLPDHIDYNSDTLEHLEMQFTTHAEGKMSALVESCKSRANTVKGIVLNGQAAEAIIACAHDKQADLIIIATHGTQGFEKVLLGSVADRVIKGAPCPVMVFNPFRKERGYEVCSPLNACMEKV